MVAVKKVPQNRSEFVLREYRRPNVLAGFIFVCNNFTLPDLERKIFGLPLQYVESVQAIQKGMPLFLFNYSTRLLHGIYEAASDGGFNLDPYAWGQLDPLRAEGRFFGPVSKYPAQVCVRSRVKRPPLDEETFRPVLDHLEGNKFRLELSADQVQKLFELFGVSASSREVLDERYWRLPLATLACQDPGSPISTFKTDSDGYSECSSKGPIYEGDEWADDGSVQEVTPAHLSYNSNCEACLKGMLTPMVPGCYQFPVYDNGQYGGDVPSECVWMSEASPLVSKGSLIDSISSMNWKANLQRPEHNGTMEPTKLTPNGQLRRKFYEPDFAVHSYTSNCAHSNVESLPEKNELDMGTTFMLPSAVQAKFPGNDNVVYLPVPRLQCQPQLSHPIDQRKLNGAGLISKKQVGDQGVWKAKDAKLPNFHQAVYNQQIPFPFLQNIQHVPFIPLPTQRTMPAYDQPMMVTPVMVSPYGQCFTFVQPIITSLEDTGLGYQQLSSDGYRSPMHNVQDPAVITPPSVSASPPQFATSLAESLHFDILHFARETRPSTETLFHVEAAIVCVRNGVKMLWPEADVEVFGSFATGLCLQHSDVDLAVVGAPAVTSSETFSSTQASAFLIKELAASLKDLEWCESYDVIANASVPVFKCRCRPFISFTDPSVATPVISIDISIAGVRNGDGAWNHVKKYSRGSRTGKYGVRHTGGAAREYVLNRICELPALAPLVLLLKSFLQHRGLSNVYSGGLGSYSLTLLLAFYLERLPISSRMLIDGTSDELSATKKVTSPQLHPTFDLPNLSDEYCGSVFEEFSNFPAGNFYVRRAAAIVDRVLSMWDSSSLPYLGTLLLGFLRTFGAEIDLSAGKIVLKGMDGSPGGFFKRDNRHIALWVDDPLRPGVNVGAGSFAMCQVQDAFRDILEVFVNQQMLAVPLQCTENACEDLAAMNGLSNLSLLLV